MSEKFEEGKGRVKEPVGDATGDRSLQSEGKADQVAAKVKGFLETAKDRLSAIVDSIRDRVSRR